MATTEAEPAVEIQSGEPNEAGYRPFQLGEFKFRRDDYFVYIEWPTGSHVMSADAFLKALQRDVALKILPEHLTDDPERLARFQRATKTRRRQAGHGTVTVTGSCSSRRGRPGTSTSRRCPMRFTGCRSWRGFRVTRLARSRTRRGSARRTWRDRSKACVTRVAWELR